jgi:hypothetical protein
VKLDERGFGGRLVRADQPGGRPRAVELRRPVEAAEQTVRRYEELELGLDLAAAGA